MRLEGRPDARDHAREASGRLPAGLHTRMRALPSGVVGRRRFVSNFSSIYSLISIDSTITSPSSISVGTTPLGLSAT